MKLSLLAFSAEEAMTLLKEALGDRAGDVSDGVGGARRGVDGACSRGGDWGACAEVSPRYDVMADHIWGLRARWEQGFNCYSATEAFWDWT